MSLHQSVAASHLRRVAFAALTSTMALLAAAPAAAQLDFFTVLPCRVYDSRTPPPLGGNPLDGTSSRFIQIAGLCGVPANAEAVSLNLTVTESTGGGSVFLGRGDSSLPSQAAVQVSFQPGHTRANNGIVQLSTDGLGGVTRGVKVQAQTGAGTTVHVILDVNGFFPPLQPPVLAGAGTVTFTEDGGPIAVAPSITVTDPDDANLQSATVTITNPLNGASEVLAATSCAGLTVTPGLNSLSITGNQPLATYQTCLQSVTYDNTAVNVITTARSVDFVANDGTSNSNTETATVNITNINDAPAGTDGTVGTTQGTDYVFTAADFGFTDPNDTPPNALLAVKIATLPAVGSLTLSGGAVSAGQFISATDIGAGNLKFTPAGVGTPYTSFTFQVQDDGGTAGGGVDLDPTPNTLTINVDDVNDAPAGTDNTVSTAEDTDYTFAAADFGFTDPNDTPADNFAAVVITTLPAAGTLKLSGNPVIAGQEIPAASIGSLTFSPAPDASGSPYATFTFQVRDDGGTANGGVDLDPTPNTMTVNVTAADDPPVAVDDLVTVNEDSGATTLNLQGNDTDSDGGPIAVQSVTDPPNGTATVVSGNAVYTPDPNYCNGTSAPSATPDTFTYTLTPGGDTGSVSVTVICINDAPAGTNNTVATPEDTDYTFAAADFGFTDPNDTPANALQSVVITTLPGAGSLTLSGNPVVAGQEIPVASIANLKFTPAANGTGSPYTTFTFQVRDDGGTANGGVDLDPTPNTMTINVTAVNDPPAGTDNTVTTAEDTPFTFATANFGFTDPNDTPANLFQSVVITTLPGAGSLTLAGNPVVAGQEIPVASIGNLVFTPAPDANGSPYASFTFQVRDDGGTANSGVDLDPTPNTMTINVTAVDDPPVAVDDLVTVNEDSGATTLNLQGNDTDIDGGPIAVLSVTDPPNGTATVVSGNAVYTPDPNYCNAATAPSAMPDTFTYTLTPGGDVGSVSVTVICVNDPPTVLNESFDVIGNTELRVDMTPGTTPHASETTVGASAYEGVLDNDGDPEGDTVSVTAVLNGCSDLTAPFDCTLSDGAVVHVDANGEFSYTPGPGDTTGSFTYTVTDQPPGGGALSVNGTVTFNFNQMVWYVDPNAGGGGNGTSILPLNSLDSLDGAGGAGDSDSPGDYIFVHDGTLALSGPMEMEGNQHLIGQGHVAVPGFSLSIPVNLNGNGSPTNLVATGTHPQLTNAIADPNDDAITLGNSIPIEIVGLSLASTNGNAIDLTSTAALTGASTLAIGNNELRGAGAEGIDVNMNAGTNGTLTLNFTNNSWDLAGTHNGNSFDARTASASANLRLNFSNNTNILSTSGAPGASAVFIDGSGGGTVTITGFANNTVHQNTVGNGMLITSATFDADPGTAGFQQVIGGTTVVGAPGDGVGSSGIALLTVSGDLAFTDLDIFASGNNGLQVAGTGAFTGAAGTRVTVGAGVGIIEAPNSAVNLSSMTADLQLSSLKSTGTTTTGVSLTNVSDGGTTNAVFSAGSGSSITTVAGATGPAFNVSGGNAKITYGGTITNNSTSARAVSITTWSGDDAVPGDDILLSGAIDENGAGILLNGNGGSRSITFSGGMDIDTLTNEGFAATSNTNSGGLHITGINTIDTTTATALRVTNTGIGNSGLTFRTINAGTGSGSSGVGIVLDTTGTAAGNGGLTVSGTGSAGSGGIIQHKTGADGSTTAGIGIFLNNTKNPSFNWMQLNDFDNSAITGRNVQDFTLQNSVINGVIGTTNVGTEGPVNFGVSNPGGTNGLQGTGLIRNTKISGGVEHNLEFYNQSGSMSLTIDGVNAVSEGANPNSPADDTADCIVEENSVGLGGDGIQIEMQSTATATIVIDRCLFRDNKSQAVQVSALNSTSVNLTIDESFARKFDQGNEGFILQNGADGDLTTMVSNNRINNFGGTAIFVGQVAGNATAASALHATISGNIITQPTTATNHGIIAFLTSTVGQLAPARVRIDGNNVTNNSTSGTTRGIIVDTPDSSTSPVFHATVTNNTVSVGDNVAGVAGIVVQGRQSADTCANIGSNTVSFPNGTPAGVLGLRARQVSPATYDLEQSASCMGTAAAVLACRNPGSTTEVLGTLTVVPAGSCLLPNTP